MLQHTHEGNRTKETHRRRQEKKIGKDTGMETIRCCSRGPKEEPEGNAEGGALNSAETEIGRAHV